LLEDIRFRVNSGYRQTRWLSLPPLTSAKEGMRGEAEDRPSMAQEGDRRDQEIRAALDRHWAASDASDFEAEHSIYHEDAVLEYPQSGERIRSRRDIQITRANQPSKKRFLPCGESSAAAIFGSANTS
jgi:hypothetical protein